MKINEGMTLSNKIYLASCAVLAFVQVLYFSDLTAKMIWKYFKIGEIGNGLVYISEETRFIFISFSVILLVLLMIGSLMQKWKWLWYSLLSLSSLILISFVFFISEEVINIV